MKDTKASYLSTVALRIGYTLRKKENRLFEDLNLELKAGELVCFMGPNGVGKSSLIRTLAGLQKPLSGKILINSLLKNQNPSHQISVVLTNKITVVAMTVYEVVAFGRYPYLGWSIELSKEDHEIIDRSIAMARIEHLVHQKLYELSDGQLQMVMIARALAQDTPIILLDEPTAHLDLNNRVEIMKLLRQLARTTNKAILVSTHELDLALQMADLIWLSGRNKNLLTGLPEDLILNGSFDAIFEFKGFDLKTGKIKHETTSGITVQLTGEGAEYLWTKNALERNGIAVTDQQNPIHISIVKEIGSIQWFLRQPASENRLGTLAELINHITQTIAVKS
jgi:iron complex transport system ATP-binding protein